jgi:hypothetical protein
VCSICYATEEALQVFLAASVYKYFCFEMGAKAHPNLLIINRKPGITITTTPNINYSESAHRI